MEETGMGPALRILHVEDNADDAGVIHRVLLSSGLAAHYLRVDTAGTFRSALEHHAFDLILSDHDPPRFDGLACLTFAKQCCPEVPFIVVSGAMDRASATHTLTCGATDYVSKRRLTRLPAAVRHAVVEFAQRREQQRISETLKVASRVNTALLREVHHRVKNNMQMISSLLNLQLSQIGHPVIRRVLQESQTRIHAIAMVHEHVYGSNDLIRVDIAEYLRHFTAQLFQVYGVELARIALEIDASRAAVSLDAAVPCGLIVNELVSNALKHAFPNGRQGSIRVAFRSETRDIAHADWTEHTLVVQDRGVGFPRSISVQSPQTLGLQLVASLVAQLSGSLELDRSGGTTITITFHDRLPSGIPAAA